MFGRDHPATFIFIVEPGTGALEVRFVADDAGWGSEEAFRNCRSDDGRIRQNLVTGEEQHFPRLLIRMWTTKLGKPRTMTFTLILVD